MAWQLSKKQRKIIECIAEGMSPKKLPIRYQLIEKRFIGILLISESRLKFITVLKYYIL